MEHEINGVAFRVTGMRAPIKGSRFANGAELTRDCAFADLRALIGERVPGLGLVVAVGSPRLETLRVGQPVNLVTLEE
jgi:hypothetical protein